MSAIKKFFEKRKANSKFKSAGRGHTLNSPPAQSNVGIQSSARPVERVHPTQSSQMAGVAAIQRIEQQQRNLPSMANRSQNVIRAEAKKELEEEMRLKKLAAGGPKEIVQDSAPVLSVNGVFFKCSLIGPEILPKSQMEIRIKEFLYEQLEEEPQLTPCLIIQTCNQNKEKVQLCVELLCKCLNNIIDNPTEEKFHKIRVNTKAFQEKILPIEGAVEFLLAAGFERKMLPHIDGPEEEFFVFPKEKLDAEQLQELQNALVCAEPIRPELDRNVRVLATSKLLEKIDIPPEFYNLTVEDVKREQMLKTDETEKNLMLRTKAMREREAVRELRRYRYCLIRVRFPDGLLLQGTFKTWEKLSALFDYVREHLSNDLPFILSAATGQQLNEIDSSLAELHLAPAAIVNFAWEPSIAEDIAAASTQSGPQSFLKPETLALYSEL